MDDLLDTSLPNPETDTSQPNPTELNIDALMPFEDEDGAPVDPPQEEAAPADAAEGDEPTPAATIAEDAEVELDAGRKVKLSELKESFQHFTRKSQEFAERERTVVTQAREAVAAHSEKQAHELHLMAQSLQQLVMPGFDEAKMQALAYEDPQQFYAVKARLDVVTQQRQRIEQAAQQAWSHAQSQRTTAKAEADTARQELLKAEGGKLAAQKWYTPDFQAKALAFVKKHGVPEQMAQSIEYAGLVEITRKAMQYDEAMARQKAGKQPATQATASPGARPAQGAVAKTKAVTDSYAQARKSNNYADMGAFLDKIL